jgi:L-cysteate sulfo-lyase
VPISVPDLRAALAKLPRASLAHLPTPLEPMPRLSAALGDVELWIKRDDCTGLAMGGNKTRQLEFTLGDALAQGADCIIQGAASQSNHCRQAAAAGCKLGLECHLVLCRDRFADPVQGNLLLDRLFGAVIHWREVELGPAMQKEKEALAERLRGEGKRPYVIGGHRGEMLAAAAYAIQVCELAEQCAQQGFRSTREGTIAQPDAVYVCSAGSTHAGLALGTRAIGWDCPVQAIAPIRWDYNVPANIAIIANRLAEAAGLNVNMQEGELRHSEDYLGAEYGVLTREARVAIELVARTEGILLDPSYTGKAMAGLIDHVRRGIIRPGSRVVFIHTGGTPALFAYAAELGF